MQQIVAYETDLLEYGDIFDGSKVIDAKVEDAEGGGARRTRPHPRHGRRGRRHRRLYEGALVAAMPRRLEAIETGEQVVVGVNAYTETEPSPLPAGDDGIITVDPSREIEQIERLQAWRQPRDDKAVRAGAGRAASRRGGGPQYHAEPRSPRAKAGVTTGEWGEALREVFGEYRAPTGIGTPSTADTASSTSPRRGRARLRQARPHGSIPGRQAGARRPFQRRRADRGARDRCRHGGRL